MKLYYLKKISLILDDLNIKHVIFDGALLGFIRDGNLIEWDWDAEISINYNNFKYNKLKIIELIEKASIGKVSLNNSYSNPKINITLNNDFKYTIQAFHYTKDKKYIYRKMYKYPAKYLDTIEIIKIKKYLFPIPAQAEELLCLEYGTNWRVPLQSTNKDDYLSKDVYTRKNNNINITYIKIKQKIYYYFKKISNIIKNFLNKYPVLEYRLNKGRERLFILQIYKIAKRFKKITFIEIGSSDLNESIILTSIFGKKFFNSVIYEASEETYNTLKNKKIKFDLANINIFNQAIVPDSKIYFLRKSKEQNLNRIISDGSNHDTEVKITNIRRFDQIEEIYPIKSHKILKMDIEGLEEELLNNNITLLSKLENISLCIELHQQTYEDPKKLKETFLELIRNKFTIEFVEFSMYCNPLILKEFLTNKNFISKNNNRYLIKKPKIDILDQLVNCDYRIIKKNPFYSPKNVRSVTFHKNK